MVELKTEQIRCALCNKKLDFWFQKEKELNICGECQAYFCPTCLQAIKDCIYCPAAPLRGAKEHKLRLVKILPPKLPPSALTTDNGQKSGRTIRFLPRKTIQIIPEDQGSEKEIKEKTSEDKA
ncbi:MAG: hypothetical protein GF308_06965 [Candidatus Heimdallarchaeota archaeon]|nr:hypothetical protein [Candidatus Heimdallarchaeota archaeon]